MRRGLVIALAVAALAGAAGSALVLVKRRGLAERALGRWLEAHGIESKARVSRLGFRGLQLDGVSLGAPDAPDLTAERIELRWSFPGLFGRRAEHVEGSGVRLRVRSEQGHLSLGTLDRLIEPSSEPSETGRLPFDSATLRDVHAEIGTASGTVTAEGTVTVETRADRPGARVDLQVVTPWGAGRVLGRLSFVVPPGGPRTLRWRGKVLAPSLDLPGYAKVTRARASAGGTGSTLRARFLAPDVVSTWRPPVIEPLRVSGTAAGTLERLLVDTTAEPQRAAQTGSPTASARAKGTVGVAGGAVRGDVAVALKDVDLATSAAVARRVSGVVTVRLGGSLSTPPGQMLAMAGVDTVLPLTNGVVVFQLAGDATLVLERAEWGIAGGTLRARGRLPLVARERTVTLAAEGLELETLLARLALEGLSGTGTLAGELPLRQRGDLLLVENGRLAATGPGILRYERRAGTEALRRSHREMDVLLAALEDFHYDELSLALAGDTAGPMSMTLHIRGRNPRYERGREVVLNVNVEAPLAGLVRTGSSAYRVPDAIEKKLDAMGLEGRR